MAPTNPAPGGTGPTLIRKLYDALTWTGGAADFQPGDPSSGVAPGCARKGWEEIVQPVLEEARSAMVRAGAGQAPSIGCTVHYQAFGTPGGEYPSKPRAAVVTDVHEDGEATLCVLNPSGIFFVRASFDAAAKPGTWRWPPRMGGA